MEGCVECGGLKTIGEFRLLNGLAVRGGRGNGRGGSGSGGG